MADVFENRPDLVAERQRLLDLIAQTPNLDWLLLTKRIHLVRKQLPKGYDFRKTSGLERRLKIRRRHTKESSTYWNSHRPP